MQRELANKMYSPTAYFLGRFLSNLILQIFYPMIMIFVLFWGVGMETSWENFWWLCAFGNLSNMVFCG
jgi:ABC-type multidrug transport system permease subunit